MVGKENDIMRFTKLEWGVYLGLGLLLGSAVAAHRSGLRPGAARAQEPAAKAGDKKGEKTAPKLQPLESLPRPEPPFKGQIDRIATKSRSDFPKEVKAPK